MYQGLTYPTSEPATLVALLGWRARQQPEGRAYTFLSDGVEEGPYLTYAELDRRARAIGALLQRCAAQGDRALLLYPAGLEFITAFLGCLYSGVIAVPAYPPHPARPQRTLPRLRAIAHDAQPALALTTTSLLSVVEHSLAPHSDVQAPRCLATDTIAGNLAEVWQEPALSADTIAFLQYTSGSTAAPKGVMVSHGNLWHNERGMQWISGLKEHSTVVSWLPLYHDMGLIGTVLHALYIGAHCVLMSPAAFLQRPWRWLHAISRYRACTSGAPNFAYDLCVRKIAPAQRETLDLSSWRVAFSGSEPIRSDTLDQFAAAFATCGFRREVFYPCYGLAEGTLMVAGSKKATAPVIRTFQATALERLRVIESSAADDNARSLVGCGRALPDQNIAIVDPESGIRRRPHQVGEIWVSGPSVAHGYWNRPAERERAFRAFLADSGEGPFLRTGDLGFVQDDELFITGRLKDLIIIDGRNHAPQDIELTVEQSHPALRLGGCAAFAIDRSGAERLVIVAEVEPRLRLEPLSRDGASAQARRPQTLEGQAVLQSIRQAVAEHHELPVDDVWLLKAGSIPKTSSGKIQRHACRAGFLAGTLDVLKG